MVTVDYTIGNELNNYFLIRNKKFAIQQIAERPHLSFCPEWPQFPNIGCLSVELSANNSNNFKNLCHIHVWHTICVKYEKEHIFSFSNKQQRFFNSEGSDWSCFCLLLCCRLSLRPKSFSDCKNTESIFELRN